MNDEKMIEDTAEDWENGKFGQDAKHTRKVSREDQEAIEETLGLKMISIRLPADLIQAYKDISEYRGIYGYQPLMRDALKRFAESEMKVIMTEVVEEKRKKASVKVA